MAREVVSYTAASDTGELHFKYSGTLSSSVDTDVYIYYGNSSASDYAATDRYGKNNVWASYEGAWHLSENTGTTNNDSTVNNNNLTMELSPTWTDGKLSKAIEFDTTNWTRNSDVTSDLVIIGDMSGSAWVNLGTGGVGAAQDIFIADCDWPDNINYVLSIWDRTYVALIWQYGSQVQETVQANAYLTLADLGTWINFSVVRDTTANTVTFYKNGVQFGDPISYTNDPTIGTCSSPNMKIGNGVDGIVDEVRVSASKLSGTEITTQYNNQNSSSTFYSVGTEDIVGIDRTIRFTAGTTQTVTGTWTVTGSASNLIKLESSTTSAWTINPTAASVSYASVSYSTNTGVAFCATYSENGGNNTSWSISSTASCAGGNVAPDSPSALAQKTVADATITTGAWVSATSIKFSATATDTNNPDTLYLCVETDILGTGFSNTEDSCDSTGVSYSGTGVTVTHTISGLTDASQYHWQVRVKDTAGAYSGWVAYGGNAESAADYGLDTTAPTGGTVYDGTSAGVDATFSDSSLSALSANWGSINSDVSGLVKYEYSIGITAGGTTIKTWTDNSTTTSVTATGLTLSSSTPYYFNVRTTDAAGNVSTPISSNGQLVSPSLSFTVSPLPVTFTNLSATNSYSDTKDTTLTTSTNAYNGYVIRAFVSDYLRSTDTVSTIPDFTAGTYASPATWAGAETGLGYTSSDTTIGGANKFGTGTLYAPFSHTGPGDIVADHTNTVSGTPVSNEVFTLTYKVKTPATQDAKKYSNTVILTATAQY